MFNTPAKKHVINNSPYKQLVQSISQPSWCCSITSPSASKDHILILTYSRERVSPLRYFFFHRKKCSTIIKLFRNIYPRLQKFFNERSNGKSLSNCNRNSRGQSSVWISWFFLPCTITTYRDGGFRQLDKMRSSPIIILLYLSWYCVGKPPSTNQKLDFLTMPIQW